MTIPFDVFFKRVREATDITTQMGLADALGVNRSAITQAKLRDAVPPKWILALARHCTLSPDWLEFGAGAPRPGAAAGGIMTPGRISADGSASLIPAPAAARTNTRADAVARSVAVSSSADTGKRATATREQDAFGPGVELVYVPKARARLCAGGGSFEIEAIPVAEHPFPYQWLARMGSPKSMVFMDVVGDSMEPGIRDGDMVLVDQSATQISPHAVHAVGLEDSIYLKRVEKRGNGILLHSDNPGYSDMEIYGDELDSFHIIGKIVWLCRDCRYY